MGACDGLAEITRVEEVEGFTNGDPSLERPLGEAAVGRQQSREFHSTWLKQS